MLITQFTRKLFSLTTIYFMVTCASGQNQYITTPASISEKDFKVSSPVVDSNANAVVLVDLAVVDFEGNDFANVTMVLTHTERILIRNRNAFEAATIKIPIKTGEYESNTETFEDLEATTYNLEENGTIKTSKLNKSELFEEKVGKYLTVKKFTFPDVKEGSILEYKYTVRSPYWDQLYGWRFQGRYPVLWGQYQITIPPMFDYLNTKKGYVKFAIDSIYKEHRSYTVSFPSGGQKTHEGDAVVGIWAVKDCPAFKTEPYTSSPSNYLCEINFFLNEVHWSSDQIRKYVKPWKEIVDDQLKRPTYSDLTESNNWLNSDLKKIEGTTTDEEQVVRKVYNYVRDNFANKKGKTIMPSQPLKKTFQSKEGNVADINLLFTAMLRKIGIDADPVMLGTRENGKVHTSTPLMREYNYLVVRVKLKDKTILLDASQNMLGFGVLPEDCLNGSGRVLNSELPETVPMSADSVTEKSSTLILLYDDSIKGLSGTCTKYFGNYESFNLRKTLTGQGKEKYISYISKSYPSDIEINNIAIDSEKLYDEPLGIRYDMQWKMGDDETLYLNPVFNEGIKKNPFVASERHYPVEMPYKKDNLFVLNMDIPKGYKVDELPKSLKAKLNENDGIFEYLCHSDGTTIQLRCHLVFKKATFPSDDYKTLREFYDMIAKKEAEQIVLKKIK